MKKILPYLVIGVLVLGICFSVYGYFATKADLKAKQAQYDAYRKLSIAEEAAKDAQIAGLQEDNANLRKINGVLNAQVIVDDQIIFADKQTIAYLQKNEPQTTPEQEKLPIVVNLRAQVKALSVGFADAQKAVADVKLVNLNLVAQLGNDEKIIADVNAKYNSEHALRMSCEALSAAYKKAVTPSFFGSILKDWKQELVVAVIAGAAGHFLK
jgi:hypothetical protein